MEISASFVLNIVLIDADYLQYLLNGLTPLHIFYRTYISEVFYANKVFETDFSFLHTS